MPPLRLLLPILLFALAMGAPFSPVRAEDMSLERMNALIERVGAGVSRQGGVWDFSLEDVPVMVVTDVSADRMRIMTPIRSAEGLTEAETLRLLQANFDSALDARYGVARGVLWSTFIHPFGSLEDEEFLSGLGQTVNLALTYGSSYSSGALVFGGGDSSEIERRELIDKLLEQGQKI